MSEEEDYQLASNEETISEALDSFDFKGAHDAMECLALTWDGKTPSVAEIYCVVQDICEKLFADNSIRREYKQFACYCAYDMAGEKLMLVIEFCPIRTQQYF